MQPVGIHHVSVNVDDVAAAVAFYTNVLGFVERSDRPDFGFGGAWLDVGGQQLHLIEGKVPDANGQHYAVWVKDMAAALEEIRSTGTEVSDPVQVGRNLQAFLTDPAGNTIELHEVGA